MSVWILLIPGRQSGEMPIALPFMDNSFEFILSIAVLEHIQYPFMMIKEVHRVLNSGGIFIGTVAFLEPFHGNSYYHYTHLGVYNMLVYGGFEVEQLAPGKGWQVFDAQARMNSWAIFPGMSKFISKAIIRFPQVISNIWWRGLKISRGSKNTGRNFANYTGSFCFVARKKL